MMRVEVTDEAVDYCGGNGVGDGGGGGGVAAAGVLRAAERAERAASALWVGSSSGAGIVYTESIVVPAVDEMVGGPGEEEAALKGCELVSDSWKVSGRGQRAML